MGKIINKKSKLSFGTAMDFVRDGIFNYMNLPRWSSDVKICVQFPDENSKMTEPYFYVESRYGKIPWIPNMIELFSEDWEVRD